MKKQVIEKKLTKLGYKIIMTFEGNLIATKNQITYKAAS